MSTAPAPLVAPEVSRLGPATASLLGWCTVAAAHAFTLYFVAPDATARVVGEHQAYAAAYFLALGVLSLGVVWVYARWAPPRKMVRYAALTLVALAAAYPIAAEDVENFAQSMSDVLPTAVTTLLLLFVMSLSIPGAVAAGGMLRRPWWRWFALSLAAAVAVANHEVLPGAYPGGHFYAAWAAAAFAGSALCGARLRRAPPSRTGRWGTAAVKALAVAAAVAAVLVVPSPAVWARLCWSPASVVAPFLGRLYMQFASGTGADVPAYLHGSRWFQDLSRAPATPPSGTTLLPEGGIVVLLVIDALRADLVENKRDDDQLPALARLREQSYNFTVARSAAPSTVVSMTSTFTGKYYSSIYWSSWEGKLYTGVFLPHHDDSPRLPALLAADGVRTVNVPVVPGVTVEMGVGMGFEEQYATKKWYAPAEEVMTSLMAQMEATPADRRAFFYAHFVDAHAPYNLAGTEGSQFARYVREVALVDAQLKRYLELLDSSPFKDRVITIVTADHGEAFGEHNNKHHTSTVYDEVLRVPLMVRTPGAPARRIAEPVSLMDLGPTILDLFGLPTPGHFMGESLVPFLEGRSRQFTRPIVVDSGRRIQAMFFRDGKKIILDTRTGVTQLYDLVADPREKKNLVETQAEDAAECLAALHAFFGVHALKRPGYTPPWRQF
jgi:arylsulfatase A-like enzyme